MPHFLSSSINFYGIATANNKLVFQADNSDGADIYALNAAVIVIPVTLKNFTAELKEGTVILNWSTEQEVNLSHFNIQKRSISSVTNKENKQEDKSKSLYKNILDQSIKS